MGIAAQAHRDRIHRMTAIPPLLMDENMLQLQTRSAAFEEQAVDLQNQLRSSQVQNAALQKARRKARKERRREQQEHEDAVQALTQEGKLLRAENADLMRRLTDSYRRYAVVNTDFRSKKREWQVDKEAAQVNQKITLGWKTRMDTAEKELERLKRKRKDSISPERVITGILQRPNPSPLSSHQSARADNPPASAQPTPKKSRSRKEKWSNSVSVPLTSFNQDDVQERRKEQTSQARKRDPVLNNPPSNVGRKNDIIAEIEESARTLSLSREDTSLVFYRSNPEDQVVVTKKALAYVESIITTTCIHRLKVARIAGNAIQAYLDSLSFPRVVELQKEVDAALEQCEDSKNHMAVYRGGDDLARRVRNLCFDKDNAPLRPHKMSDTLRGLHDRLGCYSQHSIPIGFYYAKWSEKLSFHPPCKKKGKGTWQGPQPLIHVQNTNSYSHASPCTRRA
jgi:hypothetical protein